MGNMIMNGEQRKEYAERLKSAAKELIDGIESALAVIVFEVVALVVAYSPAVLSHIIERWCLLWQG